jgi:VanZ family protein
VRKLRFVRWWVMLGAMMVVVILLGSLLPHVPTTGALDNDKVNHLIGYLGLTAWFTALVQRSRYWVVIAALLVFGAGVEVAQATMNLGRSGDWRDMIANSVGIAAGLAIAMSSRESWLERVERWLGVRV